MLNPALVQIRDALAQVPYIAHINNQGDYEQALRVGANKHPPQRN